VYKLMIIVVWQMTYHGEQWLGNLRFNHEQDRYSTVLLETMSSKKLKIV